MKLMTSIFVVICICAIIGAVGQNQSSGTSQSITHILPFLGGHELGIYDAAGCLFIAWTCLGVARLLNPRSAEEEEYEEVEPDEDLDADTQEENAEEQVGQEED